MRKIILIILSIFATGCWAINKEHFKKEINDPNYYKTSKIPIHLRKELEKIPDLLRDAPLKADITCTVCYSVANLLVDMRRNNKASYEDIALEAALVCTILGFETGEVCRGLIDINLDILIYIVDQYPDVKGNVFCDLYMQNMGCNSTDVDWTIDIPAGTTVSRKAKSNPEKTFPILLVSDIHYDPNYTPGKVKNCGEPLCCQKDQPNGNATDGTACGYWSEYKSADASEHLVDESLRKAGELNFDYVYFLGDVVSHRLWSTSIENNTKALKTVFGKLKTAFKNKAIYPILGNHEPTPVNQYSIGENVKENLSANWLYELFYNEFSQWLPKETKTTILKGGYYTVSPKKGFRIIGLNNNVAYYENWWLAVSDKDPYDQLAWLAQTLKEAEDKGEIVHILSHIPSGKKDLRPTWSREYHKIVERFANTIAAQFNGHTHHDEFAVFYSSKNTTEAINVALNGASVICDRSNPSVRLVYVDNANYDIIDTDQWTFNLVEANKNKEKTPNWYKLYSFREKYKVKSLAPLDFTELVPRMASKHELLSDYHIFRYRNSTLAIESGCDNDCKRDYLCEMSTSQVGDKTQCDWLKEVFNDHI